MRRRLLPAFTILSLAGFGATAAMWIDSHDAIVQWGYSIWSQRGSGEHLNRVAFLGKRGRVAICWTTAEFRGTGLRNTFHRLSPPGFHRTKTELAPLRGLANVDIRDWWRLHDQRIRDSDLEMDASEAMAPAWLVMAVTLIPSVAWLSVVARARRRKARHLCAACGYNLTGNTSGVCPECGLVLCR